MSQEIDFDEILAKYRSDPYNYIDITAPHTGLVNFLVEKGSGVDAPSGEWNHISGTPLFQIIRERNEKEITAPINGIVSEIRIEFQDQFVEAGEKLLTIRHPLKKKDIIEAILKEVLYLFPAPETAKFFFSMDVQSRIDQKGSGGVTIRPGDEVFTMSLMKRDTPVYYSGEEGVIHSIYFKPGVSVSQGEPLIGVCPADKLPLIQKVITRVKAEWDAM
jgi:acetyl/propionyl-CoA carboxylase alpha subunit